MYQVQTFNNISAGGLERFENRRFEIGPDAKDPDGVLVRSADLSDYQFPPSLKAIARAGAGTNNIPIERCTQAGIVVFNTPGANANSVKELVIASLFLASRDILGGVNWTRSLERDVAGDIERAKSRFIGPEIKGKKLAVIGLGAVGVLVANASVALGMEVSGYDPFISVESAWGLSHEVRRASMMDSLLAGADYVTLHLPLTDQTRGFLNAERIARMKHGARVFNFARGGLVDNGSLLEALRTGAVARFVTDFPDADLIGNPNVIPVPHLGASTPEAEENCAVMAADQLIEYLTRGNIKNSVNFPACETAMTGSKRIVIANRNIPNMVGQITTALADQSINISDMLNRHLGDHAFNIIDVDGEVPGETVAALEAIDGVLMARIIDNGDYHSCPAVRRRSRL